MSNLHHLARMFGELDDHLVSCMRCGMCQAFCPVFARTGRETDVTRGKLALLSALAREMLTNPAGVNETLNRCLLCGTCQANCPSGVRIMDIFFKARAIMTGYMGLSTTKKIIFRSMLVHPALFNAVTAMGAAFQGVFTRKVDNLLGSSCARFNALLLGDRHFKTLAAVPLHRIVPQRDARALSGGIKVAFFTGCLIDKVFPRVGEAALAVFERKGVGVFLPADQACCGIPALSGGDRQTFDKLVAMNLRCFADGTFDYLLTACATCTSTIKELWPLMFTGDAARIGSVRELAAKTMDISRFLVDVIGVKADGTAGDGTVTYHDPCHLKNGLGITAQPRTLITASGCTFKEMTEADTCCGCGGSFNLAHYGLSKEIGLRKAENIIASGADILATSCPACMLHITDMLSRKKAGITVKHVIELYADAPTSRTGVT